MRVKNEGQNEGQKLVSKMRDKNLSDQGHNSYIYQMCKRAPLPTYMRNENVIDKQALEWCSLM